MMLAKIELKALFGVVRHRARWYDVKSLHGGNLELEVLAKMKSW